MGEDGRRESDEPSAPSDSVVPHGEALARASDLDAVKPLRTFDLKPSDPTRAGRLATASWWIMSVGIALTVVLAVSGASQSAIVSAILAVVAGAAQALSVILGQRSGRPDANHVRTLARRAQKHAFRVNREAGEVRSLLAIPQLDPVVRQQLGSLVVQLEWLTEELGETVEVWRDLNPELFEETTGDEDEQN